METVLEIKNLTLSYGERILCENLNFSVNAGEIVGVRGGNGTGKSTLIKRISALMPANLNSEGSVLLYGAETLDLNIKDRCTAIATIFQEPEAQLFSSFVEDELSFANENLRVQREEIRKRINAVSELTGISHLTDSKSEKLSGGEKQLVAIASAISSYPRVILADEITARLDLEARTRIRTLLKDFAKAGGAVIFVHHTEEDGGVCDRVIEIRDERRETRDEIRNNNIITNDDLRLTNDRGINNDSINQNSPPLVSRLSSLVSNPQQTIVLNNLSFSYLKTKALISNLSMSFESGKCYLITGKNGAGKTTLGKLILGLLKPQSGSVEIGGECVAKMRIGSVAKKIGYVFQNPDLQFFTNSVGEECEFSFKLTSALTDSVKERINDCLVKFGLQDFRERNPLTLSTGEKQRLALAITSLSGVSFLLLDEPTSSLDNEAKNFVVDYIKRFVADGGGAIIITHDSTLLSHLPEGVIYEI
ncbi:MAG: energy-coupling factor ABC transporter ATP-binding protein [Firmicutes bacterium]|nr:energy-coupling factor ABC transporter ATP-binding protein [Bacillota bacterium]